MRTLVITPTYNEKENLPVLAERIFALKIPNLTLIVVDDNSPDGTGRVAEELAKKYPARVIHRPGKQGLGTAYAAAFKEILNITSSQDVNIVQMDADLSHDPAVIPAMLEKIKNCDVILGSRYVKGGKIENWDFLRRMVSWFGNLYARIILGVPYRDLTGGYKCWRREVLEKLDSDSLSSLGYNFQIETTYRAHKLGYKICETPITFRERKTGVSKFNFGIMLEAFWKVLRLRFKKK